MSQIKQYGTLVYSGFSYDQGTLDKFNVYQNLTKKLYHSTRRFFQKNSAAFWHRLSYGFERRLQKMLQSMDKGHDRATFSNVFYDSHERFLSGVFCYLLSDSGKIVIVGQLFITSNSVCFYATKKVAGSKCTLYVRLEDAQKGPESLLTGWQFEFRAQLVIPYEQIHRVVKAGIIRARGFPSIVPIAEGINPKIIQFYCADGKLHQMGGFGPAFDKIFRLIVVNGGLNNVRQSIIVND